MKSLLSLLKSEDEILKEIKVCQRIISTDELSIENADPVTSQILRENINNYKKRLSKEKDKLSDVRAEIRLYLIEAQITN